jgi:hypothetical protein
MASCFQRLAVQPAAALLFVFVGCAAAGCTSQSGALSCASPCGGDGQTANQALTLPVGESAQPLVLRGALRHDADAIRYAFHATAGMRLAWSYNGPAAHVVLTYPNGDSDGPLAPSTLALPATGLYVLALHSNTMADPADGPFTLRLRLLP